MASSLTWTIAGPLRPAGTPLAARPEAPPAAADMSSQVDAPLADASEAALVDACLQGSTEAFDVIVERHQRDVYRLCYRFVGNHEDAADLAQDVFVRAYRGLGGFRGGSALGTWLHRIAVNVCLNRLSAKAPLMESIDAREHTDTGAESPADRLLRRERAAAVRRAIGQLPPRQRATLILRIYHELSHQEIANVLGSSVGAVKANVFHALANLRKLLG